MMRNGLGSLLGLLLGALWSGGASAQSAQGEMRHGPFGPPGPRMCEQLWVLPSGSAEVDLRATVFRPGTPGEGCARDATPRPMVVINHGTDAETVASVAMPVFFWLSRWFVERGYVVVLPQRRGHGATAGEFSEGRDSCARPDHYGAAQAAADDIEAAIRFMAAQPFVAPRTTLAVGISSGGWGVLGLATRQVADLRAVVNFAGGRGAYAGGRPQAICDGDQLVRAAGRLGAEARVPSLWLYARNDSYFPPAVARRMADAYAAAGGSIHYEQLGAYGREGHHLANDRAGWDVWGYTLSDFLAETADKPMVTAQGHSR